MRIFAFGLAALVTAGLGLEPAVAADPVRKVPYYASIAAGRARIRTGPARAYPASWLYQRADLPVRVVAIHKEWRKIADPDGAEGWMQSNLMSSTRTAIVRGDVAIPMLDRPAEGGRVQWRAAPGVVGRLSQCGNGWCRMDVKGQAGFVRVDALWGVDADETLP